MKRHLPVIVLAACMLVAGAFLAFYLHSQVKQQVLSQFSESLLLVARETAQDLKSYLEVRSHDIRRLAAVGSARRLDAGRLSPEIESTFELLKKAHVTSITLIDPAGRVVNSAPPGASGADYSRSEAYAWAKEAANAGMVRLVVERPGSTGAPEVSLATPLYRPAAGARRSPAFLGALLLTIDLQAFAAHMFAPATEPGVPHQLSTWVMDAKGTLLAQSEHPEMVLRNIRTASRECYQCHGSFDFADRMLAAREGAVDYQLIGRPVKIAAFARVTFENASWIIVVNAPKKDITRFIRANFIETMGLLGVVGLVVGVVFAFVQRTARQELVIAEEARHLVEKEALLEKLRETSEYLESLFSFANAPIVVWDPERRITRFNHACERLTGYTVDEVLGRDLRVLFPDESREDALAKILEALGDPTRESPEIPIRRKDGNIRIAIWNAADIRSGDGAAVIATIAQGQDITARKQVEQMKSDFVSFATHQLRTPLAGIKWLLELGAETPGIPEETAAYIHDAREAAERLISLVSDLLDSSRLENGTLTMTVEPTDLAMLTRSVLDELGALLRDKGHRLTVDGDETLPRVPADPQLLRQVVLNLVSNAIKYTSAGGTINVEMSRQGDTVQWAVRDSGIGIPKEAQHRLFEKFFRADNAVVTVTEGTGLGLYLARLIVERHGGRIWCESEEGQGATFAFTLPLGDRAA